jgi:hypothetical protein
MAKRRRRWSDFTIGEKFEAAPADVSVALDARQKIFGRSSEGSNYHPIVRTRHRNSA